MHGWSSSAARFEVLFDSLIANGFRVVTFDLPAHGHSSGEDTDILRITDMLIHLAESMGPFEAAIGHSFGGVCLAHALGHEFPTERLILIATPSNLANMIETFCHALRIRQSTKNSLVRAIGKRLGSYDLSRDFDLSPILQHSGVPTLIIHDRADRIVPYLDGEELSRSRMDIELFATNDLGHSKIVDSPQTIRKCISFILKGIQ